MSGTTTEDSGNADLPADAVLELVLRRDRLLVIVALSIVVLLSWLYILGGAGMGMSALEMSHPGTFVDSPAIMSMMGPVTWTLDYAILMFFMWWIMMIAMMLPSAAPMILLFALINRRQREKGHPHVSTTVFALAYLLSWAAFSVVATALQAAVQTLGWISPIMSSTNVLLGGSLLAAAGIYQFTPLKQACLRHCRSPLQFISTRWRRGPVGALRMGLEHGAYCVGCCWFLMGLLFVGGVMNLYWIVGVAVLVLLEKTIPPGHWVSRAVGAALIGWAAWVLLSLA